MVKAKKGTSVSIKSIDDAMRVPLLKLIAEVAESVILIGEEFHFENLNF